MKIIGFGASSMAGAGDSEGGFFQRTQNVLTVERPALEFINRGIGGNTTRDMLARVADVTSFGDHDLIVMLGCNDVPRENDTRPQIRTTREEYAQNLRSLLPMIQGSYSLFISSFPVSAAKTGVSEDVMAEYMEIATQIAAESGFALWDLFRELRGTDISAHWANDGLHFNNDGHAWLSSRLTEILSAQYSD
jgi:lysophospholipase L1-like esterase